MLMHKKTNESWMLSRLTMLITYVQYLTKPVPEFVSQDPGKGNVIADSVITTTPIYIQPSCSQPIVYSYCSID